ncbi:EF-hand calcium-binding domain-containing protein 7 [Lamellibrachia satsuma]|nr:EF-hand calcium-binding domain-containing protein 7 [Lamellibrachia satsuma]
MDADFKYECKAAYLVTFEDTSNVITSKSQLLEVLQQVGRNPTMKVLNKFWKSDTESVSFDEFCRVAHQIPQTTESDIIKAFRKIDINGDGYISNSELKKMLTTRGEKMTTKEVQEIIDEVDENKDGKLDYKEFSKMLLNTQTECQELAKKRLEKKVNKQRPIITPRSSKAADNLPKLSQSSANLKERLMPAVTSKDLKLPRPKHLKEWQLSRSKGEFFFEEDDSIISHHYLLDLPEDSDVWITVEPFTVKPGDLNSSHGDSPIDTALYILRDDKSLVSFTEQRDARGRYAFRGDLKKGKYSLIPFTTGCRFQKRQSEPSGETKLVRKKDDKYLLSKPFKEALLEIFDMCDLDGNGLLSRDEFTWFNQRTSGEDVGDEEWAVVEENVDMKDDELTKKGFIELNQMEADDNQGDVEDLWVTLNFMGYNKMLEMDEACPFTLDVYVEEGGGKLTVTGLGCGEEVLQDALTSSTIDKGESTKIKHMKDLFLHTYTNDFRACIVVENKSRTEVKVKLDCSKSVVAVSHQPSLSQTVTVSPKSAEIGHHLMPGKDSLEWSVQCHPSIVK